MESHGRLGLHRGGIGRTFDLQPIPEDEKSASVVYEVRCAICRRRDWDRGGVGRADLVGFIADTGEWMELGRTIEIGGPEWEAELLRMASNLGVAADDPNFERKMGGLGPLHNGEYHTTIATRRGVVKVLRSLEEWPDWGSGGIKARCRRRHRINVSHDQIKEGIGAAERTRTGVLYF